MGESTVKIGSYPPGTGRRYRDLLADQGVKVELADTLNPGQVTLLVDARDQAKAKSIIEEFQAAALDQTILERDLGGPLQDFISWVVFLIIFVGLLGLLIFYLTGGFSPTKSP
ncbi:MAG: hypothetical protein HZA29_01185 [Candidatus Omnitrophica bacterium]|nr:hypothetical protein [Candidatus Omnitrophota bacterium]